MATRTSWRWPAHWKTTIDIPCEQAHADLAECIVVFSRSLLEAADAWRVVPALDSSPDQRLGLARALALVEGALDQLDEIQR